MRPHKANPLGSKRIQGKEALELVQKFGEARKAHNKVAQQIGNHSPVERSESDFKLGSMSNRSHRDAMEQCLDA